VHHCIARPPRKEDTRCVAVCCSVLQYIAVCCSALQYVAVCCSVLRQLQKECVAVCCSILQCVAVRCSMLQCPEAAAERGHVDSNRYIFNAFGTQLPISSGDLDHQPKIWGGRNYLIQSSSVSGYISYHIYHNTNHHTMG